MWGYTAAVLRYDFATAVITKDHRNCVAPSRWTRKLWELCWSLLQCLPHTLLWQYIFHIFKPLGPAPKFCVQKCLSLHVCQLERSGLNHGSQADQDTAGRDVFSGKGDLIQTHCLMCMLLSVTSQDNIKGTHIPKAS